MTPEIVIVTLILLVALVLLISERLPYDLTAIGIMVALMVSTVLSPQQAVAGFANPAPLTVGALFIVAKGLIRTGGLVSLTRVISVSTGGAPRRILLLSIVLVGLLSAFINNTPVVVMMLSVILALSGRFDLSPARFLMPISFISILAGTTTLIGTSTNIIVSDQATGAGLAPLGMFELAKVGVPVALIGGVILFFMADRLLPRTQLPIFHGDRGAKHRFIAELLIPAGSRHLGENVVTTLQKESPDIEIHEVLRGSQVFYPQTDDCILAEGDIVLVSATATVLAEIIAGKDAALPQIAGKVMDIPYDQNTQIIEAIVPPESHLLGRRIADTYLGRDASLIIVGAQRRRLHYTESNMSNLRLMVGDILLIRCNGQRLDRLRTDTDLIVVEDTVRKTLNRRKAPVALAIFTGMVLVAALGLVDILTASMMAVLFMLGTGCLSLNEAYDAVDVPVILLIIGTIALGAAMTVTGAAELYAQGFLSFFHGAGPHVVLAAFIVLTSVLSHVLSNNSTAVLLVPIGLATAAGLGVDPRPFVIGICFGASACFASPIGYQTNLLIYGPGGYRFADFLRLGMVLNVVVWIISIWLIPRYWPF